MLSLILRRLIQLPLLLLVIYTVTFILAWTVPGNPLEVEGRRPSREVEQAMRARYNLDDPFKFYGEYLWGALHGDFGPSLTYKDWTVSQVIGASLPVSIQLGAAAIIVALFLGTTVGAFSATRREGWGGLGGLADWGSMSIALIGISLPTFVTGSVLVMVFGLWLGWLPVGGWGRWDQMVLPVITLSLPFAAYIARLTRLGMIDVMTSDFIRTARAKGLSQRKVITTHALKVAFLPVLSFLGPAAAAAMTGSFVVEQVFNVPGVGQHFVTAVANKDLFLIMGVVLVFATLLIVFNLIVDVAYQFVDPRIEEG